MNRASTHFRYDVLRTFRNPRFLAVTVGLPLLIFYVVGSANRHTRSDGVAFPLYFMTAMAVYGAMFAVISPGAHIAVDRARGWTRQMRIAPLPAWVDVASKVVTAYLVALPALGVLYLAGVTLGVRLDGPQWFQLTGLLLVGLAPFVVIGIALGNLATVDTLTPAIAGVVVLFALFGGVFGQLFNGGVMLSVVKLLPSYWLVQAAKSVLHQTAWPVEGWIVAAVWTVVLVPLTVLVARRNTGRI